MNTLAFAAALSLLSLTPAAQPQGTQLRRASKPIKSVHLDLGTGILTRGPTVNNRTATTVADFSNVDLGGFMGADSGNGFCEWFDAGVKGFRGNGSDLMSSIVFAYCTSSLTPGSGGPGGSTKLGFYEGYLVGGGAPTTTVAAFTLTGLPGNTSSSSFFGGFNCFFIEVSFQPMIAFADGPIGYSWKFLGTGTSGVLGGTWPYLACVGSCSGALGGTLPDRQGMVDIIDEYCPPGTLRSSFTFGTTSGSFTSFAMEIREARDQASTLTAYNASTTPNSDLLAATPAVVGEPWSLFFARVPTGAPGALLVNVRTDRVAQPNGLTPPAPVQGRLLVSGTRLVTLAGSHDGTSGTLTVVVPPRLELLCLHFAAQAVATGGSVELSSAIEGTTGTF